MEIECFRIAYAGFIFGVTERPESNDDQGLKRYSDGLGLSPDKESAIPLIGQIMSNDRPSAHLDQATRTVLALKYRFEMEGLRSHGGLKTLRLYKANELLVFYTGSL
ncbi:hypothetical protein FOBRF1_015036 [Fusarium oxysporum]